MYTKFLSVVFFILIASIGTIQAQGAQEENEFSSENVFGIDFNTNGGLIGGGMFRHTKVLESGRRLNMGVELVNVKNPNEVRVATANGTVFIYGKKNYLFALRPQIGYEFVLFTKGKEDGIQVDAIINGGPSLGIVKPYYVRFQDDSNTLSTVPYSSSLPSAGVVGPGGFLHGFDKIKIVPGLHLKAGLSFEFGSFGGVSGIEAGALVEVYPQKIQILDVSSSYPTYNRSFFSSLYVNIYFGGRR
jgi:hypothetical protein